MCEVTTLNGPCLPAKQSLFARASAMPNCRIVRFGSAAREYDFVGTTSLQGASHASTRIFERERLATNG